MPEPLLLTNATVLDPGTGEYAEADVLALDGRITEVGPGSRHLRTPGGWTWRGSTCCRGSSTATCISRRSAPTCPRC